MTLREAGAVCFEKSSMLLREKMPVSDRGTAVLLAPRLRALPLQVNQPHERMYRHAAVRGGPPKREIGVFIMAVNVSGGEPFELLEPCFVERHHGSRDGGHLLGLRPLPFLERHPFVVMLDPQQTTMRRQRIGS